VRKDHRPYYLKKAWRRLEMLYVRRILRPQFDRLGKCPLIFEPWHVEIHGPAVSVGDFVTVAAASDRKVRFTVWTDRKLVSGITVGDYCLISPGVRISAADRIDIGNDAMIAGNTYITDSDWHDLYDRTAAGGPEPVVIAENVWIGDGAIVCKGVHIGENSVIGAGAVVTRSIPDNVVAAGNPAIPVKRLDPNRRIVRRSKLFTNPRRLFREFDRWDRAVLRENTLFSWLKTRFFPTAGD
jgi:acetyltransferase-like isoleucine patch superfamily enzyme